VKFCARLTEKEKEKKRLYRLPTEAEWEYACRGGPVQYQKYHFGDELTSDDANFGYNLIRTSTVGSYKKPNAFGLHDMHGNVWEWCSDWYDENYYANNPETDPPGGNGTSRVLRGGSWADGPDYCRAAARSWLDPVVRYGDCGFRVCFAWTN
jgi:formylglycine-generating enzyme